MTDFDPVHVEAHARAHHATDCLPNAAPGKTWSARHFDGDRTWAKRYAKNLRNYGHTFATSEDAR